MSIKIITSKTHHTAHAFVPGTKNEPFTKEQAESLCADMNARAEELGIQTRYEVKGA